MSSIDEGAKAPTINQLPSEVLAHIFSVCEYEKDNCTVLLDLACVCKHWHSTLWSFPRFWTSQSLTVHTKLKNDGPHGAVLSRLCGHLERWYGRAGDIPRELSLSFDKANNKTSVLYKYFTNGTRWKTLSFHFGIQGASNWLWLEGLFAMAADPNAGEPKPCWPDLDRLEVISPSIRYDPEHLILPLEHIAPNLAHLKVDICELRTSVFSVFPPSPNAFANLTTFDFQGQLGTESLGFYVHLLSTAPKLEVLRALDGQHDFDVARALPERYAKLVPVQHDVLKEVIMHWSPNVAVLLKSIALPELKTLDLARSYNPSNIATPSQDETPVANAVKALILNSTKAAGEVGNKFALKKLRLELTPLVVADQYEVVMSVREMVEELVLERSACWWNKSEEFYIRLDKFVNGDRIGPEEADAQTTERGPQGTKQTEPLVDLFPNLKSFIAIPGSFSDLKFVVSQSDAESFATFKAYPLSWWKKCEVSLGKAEAASFAYFSDGDDWGSGDSEGEYEDQGQSDYDEEWEDVEADEGIDDDEDEDDDSDAVGASQLAIMSMAPTPYYGD